MVDTSLRIHQMKEVDCGLMYALNGMRRFEAARRRADQLGPELFPPGAPRWIAASIITGDPLEPPSEMEAATRSEVSAILRDMGFSSLPHTEKWAVYLINLLAEARHVPLVSSSLRWAADEADNRRPLLWLRKKVNEAFDVALGIDVERSALLFTGGAE